MTDAGLFDAPVSRYAEISEDGLYRYSLLRWWGSGPGPSVFRNTLMFVMLNPSTADAEIDDPTIRRCRGFAQDMGRSALVVLNLYAFRATQPAELWQAEDPVGPENDTYLADHIRAAAEAGTPVVAAWGMNARPERVEQVLSLPGARECFSALRTTKDGHPCHPLYLPASCRPSPWPVREEWP